MGSYHGGDDVVSAELVCGARMPTRSRTQGMAGDALSSSEI